MGSHDRKTIDFASIVELHPEPINLLAAPSAKLLVRLAARHWGVRADLLVGRSRDSLVVAARHHAMWLIRSHTSLSLPAIGRLFGGRDHATVLSGIASHHKRQSGERPSPFVWTPQRAHNVLRFARSGATLGEIGRAFALQDTELLRHPNYAELRRHAREHLSARMVLRALARKAEARA